jgi:methyl-accepting chemotaxis protein
MKWFNNLKIRSKFFAVIAVLLFFLIGLGFTGLFGVLVIHGVVEESQDHSFPAIYHLATTSKHLQLARNANRQAIAEINQTDIINAINKSKTNQTEALKSWQNYLAIHNREAETDLVKKFEAEWQLWVEESEKVFEYALLNTADSKQEGLDELAKGHGQKSTDFLSGLIDHEYEDAKIEALTANSVYQTVIFVIIGITLLVVLLSLGAIWSLARSITRPVARIKEATKALAVGDLSHEVKVESEDELGELATTHNETVFSLKNLVNQLREHSRQVSSATEEMVYQAKSQVAGSSQQASAVSEISATIKNLNHTAEDIAQLALTTNQAVTVSYSQTGQIRNLVSEMVEAYEQGKKIIGLTFSALQALQDQIGSIETQQQALTAKTGVIQKVVALLDDLGKETHLLALNAAIEAAGAGVYGERFGVVADEVKRLSARSLTATKEVGQALGEINWAVNTVSEGIRQGLNQAERASHEVKQSDQVLVQLSARLTKIDSTMENIVRSIGEAEKLANSIGAATYQQRLANNQMLAKVLEIEAITQQTLSAIQQSEVAVNHLNFSAKELDASAGSFKLNAA